MKLGHIDTSLYVMPIGKHKGKTIEELPSGYLRWLAEQDWFETRYEDLLEIVQAELNWRDETNQHWEDFGGA